MRYFFSKYQVQNIDLSIFLKAKETCKIDVQSIEASPIWLVTELITLIDQFSKHWRATQYS